ncbi:MAG: TldD/PmbA family protein [Gammaproteobacteria bacterium]
MQESIAPLFRSLLPAVDFCSLRYVESTGQTLRVRQNIVEPIGNRFSRGAHLTVVNNGGTGYAATSDLSRSGLKKALATAIKWADATAGCSLPVSVAPPLPCESRFYRSPTMREWVSQTLQEKLEILKRINQELCIDQRIVDWWAALHCKRSDVLFVTADSETRQHFDLLTPYLGAVANNGRETQKRTFGGASGVQGGLEHLDSLRFVERARTSAEEALALLDAPDCPSGCADLLLRPKQMILQIHESIGHPLELDRILGDERNYAGSSFVTPDMFGKYPYGSALLNVTFDPEIENEVACYRFDDEGEESRRVYLIRNGILERPLGGASSRQRAGIPGAAASRACDWNRPAIDRMANINLEPGESTFKGMVESIEHGILMDTNRSWSIDDCRNKFQFGCEVAWVIRDGAIREMVKNPNYRGISATFWRSLKAVGNRETFRVLSVPTCGKGEPNQAIQVGHAAPACLFEKVDIFGSTG